MTLNNHNELSDNNQPLDSVSHSGYHNEHIKSVLQGEVFNFMTLQQEINILRPLWERDDISHGPWILFLRDTNTPAILQKSVACGLFALQSPEHQILLHEFFSIEGLSDRIHTIHATGLSSAFGNKTNGYIQEVMRTLQHKYNINTDTIGDVRVYLEWYMYMAERGIAIALPEEQKIFLQQSSLNDDKYVVSVGPQYKGTSQYAEKSELLDISHIRQNKSLQQIVKEHYTKYPDHYFVLRDYLYMKGQEWCGLDDAMMDIIMKDRKRITYKDSCNGYLDTLVQDFIAEEGKKFADKVLFYHNASVITDRFLDNTSYQIMVDAIYQKLDTLFVPRIPSTYTSIDTLSQGQRIANILAHYYSNGKISRNEHYLGLYLRLNEMGRKLVYESAVLKQFDHLLEQHAVQKIYTLKKKPNSIGINIERHSIVPKKNKKYFAQAQQKLFDTLEHYISNNPIAGQKLNIVSHNLEKHISDLFH